MHNKSSFRVQKKKGRTRIRTGVVRIKTESDNHYTIQPCCMSCKFIDTVRKSIENITLSETRWEEKKRTFLPSP